VSLQDSWKEAEELLRKYANRPISPADACLIRCAEIYHEPRIFTFDSDFAAYQRARNKKFQLI
jgi:predicted nucleic acid-binding protein